MTLDVDLSIGEGLGTSAHWLPDSGFIHRYAMSALNGAVSAPVRRVELSVRLVAPDEGRALNRDWRRVDRATNVLSFESGLPVLDGLLVLGDLAFCPAVIAREANDQGKHEPEHWAHLVLHGVLHLLGHDHLEEAEAARMEALEIRLLSMAGIADPYDGTAERP